MLYRENIEIWPILARVNTQLSKPVEKSKEECEETAKACELALEKYKKNALPVSGTSRTI